MVVWMQSRAWYAYVRRSPLVALRLRCGVRVLHLAPSVPRVRRMGSHLAQRAKLVPAVCASSALTEV